ncbi:hypothetical protein Syun_021920 [Stephania yunnanensis]|uniref:Vacuolar protein 14 C-terminal Fig4-binding domain-containing protein n=1 Tax=Stephania yunnanensis TaxID=152371 RepID=A0AAP0IGN4_9MAGN
MADIVSVIPSSVYRNLFDKLYEKRKIAALEIEALVRQLAGIGDYERVATLIKALAKEMVPGSPSNHRKGGLIGASGIMVGMGTDASRFLGKILEPVFSCFSDPDSTVRYYACETLYNIAKVVRGDLIAFFTQIFDLLCKLSADPDSNVQSAAHLLNSLVKDIVTESDNFSVEEFIPLLTERMDVFNPFVRQFLIGWITVLDSVPDIDMLGFLPDFLDGLFDMLSDPLPEIRQLADSALSEFLEEIKNLPMNELVKLGGHLVVPYYANILGVILPCISDKEQKIQAVAHEINEELQSIIAEQSEGINIGEILFIATRQLSNEWEATRIEALLWIRNLLTRYRAELPNCLAPLLATSFHNCLDLLVKRHMLIVPVSCWDVAWSCMGHDQGTLGASRGSVRSSPTGSGWLAPWSVHGSCLDIAPKACLKVLLATVPMSRFVNPCLVPRRDLARAKESAKSCRAAPAPSRVPRFSRACAKVHPCLAPRRLPRSARALHQGAPVPVPRPCQGASVFCLGPCQGASVFCLGSAPRRDLAHARTRFLICATCNFPCAYASLRTRYAANPPGYTVPQITPTKPSESTKTRILLDQAYFDWVNAQVKICQPYARAKARPCSCQRIRQVLPVPAPRRVPRFSRAYAKVRPCLAPRRLPRSARALRQGACLSPPMPCAKARVPKSARAFTKERLCCCAKVVALLDDIFDALLRALSDPSDKVVLLVLDVHARIAVDALLFHQLAVSLLHNFRIDQSLLHKRGALIICQLCVSLDGERVYRDLARILEREPDLDFASIMVQALNMILLTSSELYELRALLKQSSVDTAGRDFFISLYSSWCHSSTALLSLCLLAQAYQHASCVIWLLVEEDINAKFLVQLDKLICLLETPVFSHIRLQLLEPSKYMCLLKVLYGLLMLLPQQSAAFRTLRIRLKTVPSSLSSVEQLNMSSDKNYDVGIVNERNFDPMIQKFEHIRNQHKIRYKLKLHPVSSESST